MNRAHDRVEPLIKDFRDENPDGKLTEDYLKRFDAAVQARVKAFPWGQTLVDGRRRRRGGSCVCRAFRIG